jgi:predicted DNA binding protein
VRLADITIGLVSENWDMIDSRIRVVSEPCTSAFTTQFRIENGAFPSDRDTTVTCKLIGAQALTDRSLTREVENDENEGLAVGKIVEDMMVVG